MILNVNQKIVFNKDKKVKGYYNNQRFNSTFNIGAYEIGHNKKVNVFDSKRLLFNGFDEYQNFVT